MADVTKIERLDQLPPALQARIKRDAIEHVQSSYEAKREEERARLRAEKIARGKRRWFVGVGLAAACVVFALLAIASFNLCVYWAGTPEHANDTKAGIAGLNGLFALLLAAAAGILGGIQLDSYDVRAYRDRD